MAGTLLLLALLAAPLPAPADAKLVKMYVRNGVLELGLDVTTAAGREKIARLERAVREDLRDRELVLAEAERRNLPVDARLDERRRQWVVRFGGEGGYRAYLDEHGLSPADFDRVIRHEIAGELLRDALTREVSISEEEIAGFYSREHANPRFETLFVEPETVTASHILVAARDGLHPDIEVRGARAERIRRELLEGADFAALAQEHSDDPGTKSRGGDLGAFPRGTHTARFDEVAFTLRPGETSPVVQTEYGFHIIRVTARTPRRTRSLDELRRAIHDRLLADKAARHMQQWLAGQR